MYVLFDGCGLLIGIVLIDLGFGFSACLLSLPIIVVPAVPHFFEICRG
jgi:hypothetical protein